jgi:hypothetical protein
MDALWAAVVGNIEAAEAVLDERERRGARRGSLSRPVREGAVAGAGIMACLLRAPRA